MDFSLLSPGCSIDGLELIGPKEVEQVKHASVADEVARQDFQARFNAYKVISIKAEKILPESESSSWSWWGGKFKVIRGIGEVTGSVRSVFSSPFTLTLPSVLPPDRTVLDEELESKADCHGGGLLVVPSRRSQPAKAGCTVIEGSDKALAYSLGEFDFEVSVSPGRLFGADGPSLSDIQQADNRSTCSILSSAATYIASSFGGGLFRQMFTEQDDHVCVRLFSSLLDKDVIARVSRSIIKGKSGKSLFSIPATGQFFMAALEKALLSLNLSYKQVVDECAVGSGHEFKGHWFRLLEGRTGKRGQVKLDYLNPARILEHFPPVNMPRQ